MLSSNKWRRKKLSEFGDGKEHLREMGVSKYCEPGTALLEESTGRAEPELSVVSKDVTWGGPASASEG